MHRPSIESVRREIAELISLHQGLMRHADRLRARGEASPENRERIDEKVRRYERLARLLDNRIRAATEALVRLESLPLERESPSRAHRGA